MIPDPRGHTWMSWSLLMVEQYAAQDVGSTVEPEWPTWANNFNRYVGGPDPRFFPSWQDWAFQLGQTL